MGRLVKSSILQLWKRRRRKRQKFCTQKKLEQNFCLFFLLILRFLSCNNDDFTHAMTSYNKIEWIQRYFPMQPCPCPKKFINFIRRRESRVYLMKLMNMSLQNSKWRFTNANCMNSQSLWRCSEVVQKFVQFWASVTVDTRH